MLVAGKFHRLFDGGVVFFCVIPKVLGPWLPIVTKLFLHYAIAELVELHVHGSQVLA